MFEEVGQTQESAWTRWETMQQSKVSWNGLWMMKPLCVSYMLREVYDFHPTPAPECGSYSSLQYILCACPKMLGKYKGKHGSQRTGRSSYEGC